MAKRTDKTITVRFPADLLASIDEAAKDGGLSRNAWLAEAVAIKLNSWTLVVPPPATGEAGEGKRLGVTTKPKPRKPVPEKTEIKEGTPATRAKKTSMPASSAPRDVANPYPRDPKECPHKFRRADGTCPACGHKRR